MKFDTEIIGAVLSGLIVGLATVLPIYWTSYRRYGLRWAVLPPQSMMEIAEDIASSVSILYKERKIDNLLRFRFVLHNTGVVPLKEENTISPLTWKAPGEIVNARVLETDPPVDLDLRIDGKNSDNLVIDWRLFNQRCKAVIEIICEGEIIDGSISDGWQNADNIAGQIEYISKIETKRIKWKNPDEIIRRMEVSLSTERPILRKFARIFSSKFIIRNTQTIAGIYMFLSIIIPSVAILWLEMENLIAASIVASVEIIVGLSLWYRFRNPYSSILGKAYRKKHTV